MSVVDVVVLLASLPICVCLKGPIRKLIKEKEYGKAAACVGRCFFFVNRCLALLKKTGIIQSEVYAVIGLSEEKLMNLEKVSVQLAYLLRHCKEPVYISLEGGWVAVDTVLTVLRQRYPEVDRKTLDQIVAADKKGRYAYDPTGTYIRANQGHSIPGVQVEMSVESPPELLYHGTASRFLPQILKEGLKPMTRQFVHISSNRETAVTVGARHGKPVVLVIRAADFVADGHELFRSANGVWQAKAVPPKYFTVEEG